MVLGGGGWGVGLVSVQPSEIYRKIFVGMFNLKKGINNKSFVYYEVPTD